MGNYFIKVDDGPDVRRKILESSKAGLHLLHGHQKLKVLRGEKLSLMNDLRQHMKELNVLINRAETLMPELTEAEAAELQPKQLPQLPDVQFPPKAAAKSGNVVRPQQKGSKKVFIAAPKHTVVEEVPVSMPDLSPAKKESVKPKPLTELEKLEQALAAVEKRLDTL
ncbi:TPA: hypothetical protein HA251_05390 [Candidatus Woesearchaeota archaeon]|nr:hypothetical protein [Candidatus Woesearchaeota archaeon]